MSLAARVALTIATLSILTAALVTGSAIVSTSSGVRSDIDDFLEERAEQIVDGTRRQPDRRDRNDGRNNADGDENNDEDEDEEVVLVNTADLDAEVQVLDQDGAITASTGLEIPITEVTFDLLDDDGRGQFETVTIDSTEYRVYTEHVDSGGAVQVATSLVDSTSLISVLRNRLLVIGALMAAAAAAIGWFIARQTLRPLGDLTAAAERVALTKDLDSAIDVDNENDEIGRLATSFNEMLNALEASRDQQHRLVQDAAHELRTPLTSVNANIDLLMRAESLPAEDRKEILTGVRAELRQLGTLFNEIIELATDRQPETSFDTLDLVGVVDQAVDDLSRRAANPITIDATSSMVVGNFTALHRAVTNLLGNAVKYSPTDSPIHVTVGDGTISVQDQGPGIPVSERLRVFDRFHRLAESRPVSGSGLGLAIVAKIVADHGGTAFVEDADPGTGAVVGFNIPTAT